MPTLEDPHDPAPDESDAFEGLVLDEDFVRGAKQKEPSARARMLAEKWKHEPPGDTSFRPAPVAKRRWYRRRPKLSAVATAKSGGRFQTPLIVLIAAVLVLIGLNAGAVNSWVRGHLGGTTPSSPQAQPSLQAPETAPPSVAPSVVSDPAVPTVAHPFAGSPAESWLEGAKAIIVPAASSVGVYSSASVASYLQHTRDFLIDSNLDPRVLAGGYPTAALALIDPRETLVSNLKKEIAGPSEKGGDGTELFTRFNPDQALIDGTVIKVQGEMTFKGDGKGGLAIHADYTFVYPLRPGPHPDVPMPTAAGPATAQPASWRLDGNDTNVARSIIRRVIDIDIPDGQSYQHTPGTLWIQQWNPDIANSACGVYNGYVNPQFPDSAGAGTGNGILPSGPASDPYDRSKAPSTQAPGTCGRLSRT